MTEHAKTVRRRTGAGSPPAIHDLAIMPDQATGDLLSAPLSGRAVFWQPRHVAPSPSLGQIPFLFWLVEILRPATIVQIGLGDGLSYMALCQAADRLGGNAICIGIDKDKAQLPIALQADHDRLYADLSILRPLSPGMPLLPEGMAADLVLITRTFDPAETGPIERDLIQHLSERAVVLFQSSEPSQTDLPLRQRLIRDECRITPIPTASSENAMLEMVLHGEDQSERLRFLAAQKPGDPAWLAARQVFRRLGQGIIREAQSRRLGKSQTELQRRLEQMEAESASQKAELSRASQENTALKAAEAAGLARQADLAARIHDQQQALERLQQANESAQAELAASEEQNARLRDQINMITAERDQSAESLSSLQLEHEARIGDIAVLTQHFDESRSQFNVRQAALAAELEQEQDRAAKELAALQQEHAARIEDIAVMTQHFDESRSQFNVRQAALATELEQEQDRAAKELAALQQEHAARIEEIAVLGKKLADVSAYRDELLRSTSWKVTGPMRGVKRMLSGKG